MNRSLTIAIAIAILACVLLLWLSRGARSLEMEVRTDDKHILLRSEDKVESAPSPFPQLPAASSRGHSNQDQPEGRMSKD